jgi:hypothetical protein
MYKVHSWTRAQSFMPDYPRFFFCCLWWCHVQQEDSLLGDASTLTRYSIPDVKAQYSSSSLRKLSFFPVGWFYLPLEKKSWLHLGLTRSKTECLSVQEIMGGLSVSVQEIMSLNFDRMGRGASDTHTQTKTSVEIRDVSFYGKRSMSWIFRWYKFFFQPVFLIFNLTNSR